MTHLILETNMLLVYILMFGIVGVFIFAVDATMLIPLMLVLTISFALLTLRLSWQIVMLALLLGIWGIYHNSFIAISILVILAYKLVDPMLKDHHV